MLRRSSSSATRSGGERRRAPSLRGRLAGHGSELGPRVQGSQLHFEQAREPALLRPDALHGRSGVAGDHPPSLVRAQATARRWAGRGRSRVAAPCARIFDARIAFRAPFSETHATGTPGASARSRGSRRGRPSRSWRRSEAPRSPAGRCRGVDARKRRGHARTGDQHPRSAKRGGRGVLGDAARIAVSGEHLQLHEIPRSSSSTQAGSIASRSDSEPMRIPTSGPDALEPRSR